MADTDQPGVSVEYTSWCDQQGVKRHGIESRYFPDGWRGVMATRHIDSGELMNLPVSCTFTWFGSELNRMNVLHIIDVLRKVTRATKIQTHACLWVVDSQ